MSSETLSSLLGVDVSTYEECGVAASAIQDTVSRLRNQVNSTIESHCAGFMGSSTFSFKDSVKDLYGTANNLIQNTMKPDVVNVFSQEELEANKLFLEKYANQVAVVTALKALSALNASFVRVDENLNSGNIVRSASLLSTISNKYFSIEDNKHEKSEAYLAVLQHLQIFDSLKEQFERKKERVQGKLDELFTRFLSIVSMQNKGNQNPSSSIVNKVEQLSVRSKVELASSDICFAELCLSYQHLGTLSEKLRQLSSIVLDRLIKPLIFQPTASFDTNETVCKDQTLKSTSTITWNIVKPDQTSDGMAPHLTKTTTYTPDVMFKRVLRILNFFYNKLFSTTSTGDQDELSNVLKDAFSKFGVYLWNGVDMPTGYTNEVVENQGSSLCYLLQSCMQTLLPEDLPLTASQLQEVQKNFTSFEREILSIGISRDVNIRESKLANYINSLDQLDAARRKNSLLSKAREAMLGDYLNSVLIDNSNAFVDADNLNGSSPQDDTYDSFGQKSAIYNLEKMSISACAKTIVMFAHNALSEMKNCTDLGKTSIWRSVMDLFLLFRAMVPSIHEKKIMTMPHVAMLHYNDCLYICHNLMILGHMYGQYLPHGQSDNLNTLMEMLRMAPAFRSMAGEVYVSEIRKQHKEIQNLLQDVDEENPTSRASELAKQGTAMHLSRLAKVWSDILGKETLNQTLGLLIAKIPRFLFPDIMAYLNNNEHVKLFEMARKICRVSSHDSQST